MDYKAFIFDYDYTLAFSEPAILICFRHVFDAFGYKGITDDAVKLTIGMPLNIALAELTGIEDDGKVTEMQTLFHAKADEVMTPYTTLYPEVAALFERIHAASAKIGIVSNKLRFRITEVLERYNLAQTVETVVGSEDFKAYKPDPEGLFMAMKELGVSATETLYVGDSIIDCLTAKNAGVDFAAVLTGTTTVEMLEKEANVKIIRRLSELFD